MPAHHAKGCSLVALASNPACAQAAKHAGASLIYIHAENLVPGQAVIAGQLSETATRTSYPQNYCVAAPIVEHEAITPAPEAKLHFGFWEEAQKSSHAKNSRIFVNSIGALQRAIEEKIPFDVGPHLPVTNKESLQTLARLGAVRVWLSFELTLKQMKELAKNSPVELGVFVAGTQELMVTQHCLLASQGACDKQCAQCARRKSPHYLLDRKSFEFPILTDAFGRSHLYNSVALDVIHTLPELLAAGISSFMVDTTLMSAQDAQNAVARAKRAIHVAQTSDNSLAKMPNTTTGHLFRGVE